MAIKFAPKPPEPVEPLAPAKPSRAGIGGRPKKADAKEQISIRLDPDVIAGYRAKGEGWQAQMNAALRRDLGI
jgi:uncharacterized protein (DUF4415 family)